MCIRVGFSDTLTKRKYFWKVVLPVSQNHFRSLVLPRDRSKQDSFQGKNFVVGNGDTLNYRVGEVTAPTPGSPGIYVFTTRDTAVRHAQYKKSYGMKTAVIKVMASTDQVVHRDGGFSSTTGLVEGPVLVVKRERISR